MSPLLRPLWRSTFGLVALVSLAFALSALGIGFVVYEVAHEALEVQLDHRIASETRALLAEHSRGGAAELTRTIRQREAIRGSDGLAYALIDATGRRTAGDLDAPAPPKPGYLEHLKHRNGGRVSQALTTELADGSRLVVAADRAALKETDTTILTITAIAFAAMLLIGIGGAWTVGSVTRARLREIDGAAQAIIDGDLSRRMPLDGSGSEFDRVSATLNRMLERIAALLDNLRQVSSDVAHDLRTPLTRLNNRLDEALSTTDEADRQLAIEAALTDSRELLDLFAALLRISEVEALTVRRHFSEVALDALLDELVDTYLPDIEASGHRLKCAIEASVVVSGDRRLLRQLVANLLDNALRHTPAGTTITVRLSAVGDHAAITIGDDGPGVAANELPRLFQRFARSERSRHTEGSGLGLALVAAIATAHRGRISALSEGGFSVTAELPRCVARIKASGPLPHEPVV
ncbi:ATP-binding protein [uncultured Nevskia sp.]|uniref:sensor histidine kinase n=1 Tax=uncultured Nevskia sp. TaxID=228950 RepID=UPI0025CEC684|nr:ATP-binding protein [uncultured Nevskia sp.]